MVSLVILPESESHKIRKRRRGGKSRDQLNQMSKDLDKLEDLEERQRELNQEIGPQRQGTKVKQPRPAQQEDIRRDLRIWKMIGMRDGKLGDVANLNRLGMK